MNCVNGFILRVFLSFTCHQFDITIHLHLRSQFFRSNFNIKCVSPEADVSLFKVFPSVIQELNIFNKIYLSCLQKKISLMHFSFYRKIAIIWHELTKSWTIIIELLIRVSVITHRKKVTQEIRI